MHDVPIITNKMIRS